jgi:hypothetical protein
MKEKLIQRQQELVNNAKAAGRELTVEEQAEFDEITAKINALAKSAETTPATVPVNEKNVDINAVREAERNRIREIEDMCGHFGIEARQYVENGASVEDARKAVMEKLMENGAPIGQKGTVDVVRDAADKFRNAVSDALLLKSGLTVEHPAEGAKDLLHMSLRDIFVETSGEAGLSRKSPDELFSMAQRQYFNPTAAFPAILDQTINKAYAEGHRKVAVTFDRFTKKGTLSDFKVANGKYLAGPVGEFLEVPEGGELKHDIFADDKLPTRQLKTYGRQFTMSRQAFINDDIDVVTKLPSRYAASARKTINKQVFQILYNNPTIYDGVALFNSAHRNVLTTGTGVTQAAFQAMLMALQTQKDQFGEAIIVDPKAVVAPVGMGFDFEALLRSETINTAGNTQAKNPLYRYRDMEIIEDPTLNVLCGDFGNTMPWFLFANPDDAALLEVDYLNGQEIPTIRRMEAPGQLGFIWDIYLDWGISVMDFRGAIKNPGTVVPDPLS